MKRSTPATILALASVSLTSCPALGQATTPSTTASQSDDDTKVAKALRSLTEPESPTFQMLGVSTNDVQRPDSPKKAALDILSSLDQNGNLQSGFAIEVNPYILVAGPTLTLDEYRHSRLAQQLSYLQIAAGFVKGSSDSDHSAKASIGLVWTPINGVDPFLNTALVGCIRAAAKGVPTPHGFPGMAPPAAVPVVAAAPAAAPRPAVVAPPVDAAPAGGAAQIAELRSELADLRAKTDQLQSRLDALQGKPVAAVVTAPAPPAGPADTGALAVTPPATGPIPVSSGTAAPTKQIQLGEVHKCYMKYPMEPDYHTSLQFGIAPLFVSESGKTGDFKARGFSATGTLSIGLTRGDATAKWRGMMLLSGTYRGDEIIPDPVTKGAFLQRDRWDFGGRFVYGKADAVFFSLESAYQHARYLDARLDNYATLVGGVDIRISDGLWLGLSAGSSIGRSVGGDQAYIGSRFRWGFGQKSAIGEDIKPAGQGGS